MKNTFFFTNHRK